MKLVAVTALLFSLAFTLHAQERTETADTPVYRVVTLPLRASEPPVDAVASAEAKVLVGGYLPSTCYRDVQTSVESPDPHTHFVRARALKRTTGFCTQSLEDFEELVSLGLLDAGEHTLIVEGAHGGVMVQHFTVLR